MRLYLPFCLLLSSGLGSMLTQAQTSPARFYPSPPPTRTLNISGIWHELVRINNGSLVVVKIRIEQTGNNVKATLTQTDASVDGRIVFEGHFSGNLALSGRSPGPYSTPHDPQWYDDRLLIDDPDHIRFEKINMAMSRANVRADDIACDSGNSYHVTANFALIRGASALIEMKDARKAVCWLTIGATQGNARAESMLAYLLYTGNGATQDYTQAFAWAQKSAAQKDALGEIMLSALYQVGNGITPDEQQSRYWAAQAGNLKPDQIWSLLNAKTPSGFTPLDAIRGVLGLVVESDQVRYRRLSEACNHSGGMARICEDANSLREVMRANGSLPDQ